ncbi:monofunctional biosynthetic peptidoglycan transglycosylase [Stigmatella aurantiaca]|uniref:Biosynthetic peptidoglycan transglycosylase n=1 Tax=Stigmatella aurantiaca (strain DW4/3-1) TaxID=378806 RepID=Q08Z43_STIAD|nr:monofunctional biosynthetic peptidoglycan transglycosylase [Stigmatella aurantiaca]ADO74499.1 Monofunctional biosynthetic peptidoglycan transglycosylase [Stigmatella aurantiaca DW4/3-1]EAU65749.1 monofunctional biosynthetic peptidoglycan transglycosylase [Stigmatella aurantiaca DW4/3-1]
MDSPPPASPPLSPAPPAAAGQRPSGRTSWVRRYGRKGAAVGGALFLAFATFEYLTLPDAGPLVEQNPKTTALMEQRAAEAREAGRTPRQRQHWVALSSVSKPAIDAVLLSEDAGFYAHEGVDPVELKRALAEAWKEGELGRGASTLTQQLAKNLWLSTDRSLLRKLKELVLARRLEKTLSKNRILALYLNVVEWGNGVYGIEAGAREHFGISASRLSVAQGAVLAAMLPSPRKRAPSSGSKALRRRAFWVVEQMETFKRISAAQAQAAREELNRLFEGAPKSGGSEEEAEP